MVAVTFDGGSPIVKSILCSAGSDQKNLEKIFNGSQFSLSDDSQHNFAFLFLNHKIEMQIYITSPFVEMSVFFNTCLFS